MNKQNVVTYGSYADKIALLSVTSENYRGENWDDALCLAWEADDRIAELEAKIKRMEDANITDCDGCPYDRACQTWAKENENE